MASLTELAEFVDQVLRLDTDMPVKGFDGFTIGTANEQAQVLANRTLWLKENLDTLKDVVDALSSRNVVASVNKKTGTVTLTYKDVGAAATSHQHSADEITPTSERDFVSSSEKRKWNDKQDELVSSVNIKMLLGNSLLGQGNIDINAKDITTDETFQFISAKERATWNGKQNTLTSGKDIVTLHGYTLLGGGNVTLTSSDVGADPAGTAEQEVDTHEQKADPHPQYLTQERASDIYVEDANANKPNGYLKLDEKGQIPANIAELFEVRYLIVASAEERLAITGSNNVTICLQTDENRIYYLDAGADPTVEDNWHNGRDADPSAVISVFGRSGVIKASNGDYTADQITETTTRVFVTPEQKTTWSGKQDKLTSGKNIRTINGTSLLGTTDIEISTDTLEAAKRVHQHNAEDIQTSSEKQFVSENDKERWDAKQIALVNGKNIKTINNTDILGDGNIDINPSGIGAAVKDHTHTPDQIKTTSDAQFVSADEKTSWNAKQEKLVTGENLATVFGKDLLNSDDVTLADVDNLAEVVGSVLQAGSGIEVKYDELTDKVNITNTSQGGTTGSDITVIFADDSKKGTAYTYTIGNKMSFDFSAYALKEKVIGPAKITDYTYTDTLVQTLPQTTKPDFDTDGFAVIEKDKVLPISTKEGEIYYSDEISLDGLTGISIDAAVQGSVDVVPVFTSKDENSSINGISLISSQIYPNYQAWKAFQTPVTSQTEIDKYPIQSYWSDYYYFNLAKTDVYLGIVSTQALRISGYSFQGILNFAHYKVSTLPTSWVLQGRNNTGNAWTDIDTQTNQDLYSNGKWKIYLLSKSVEYKQYRILVKGVKLTDSRTSIVRLQFLSDPNMLIKGKDNKFYTIKDGAVSEVEYKSLDTFKASGFQTTKGKIDYSQFNNIAPFKLCSSIKSDVKINRYAASSQIVIHIALEKTDFWYTLNNLTATMKNSGDEDRIFTMVTVDSKNWFYFKDNNWKRFGELTNDTTSANSVIEKGTTIRALTAITKEQWAVLLNSISNDATLGIAFASKIYKSNESRVPTKITANFDKLSNWVLTNTTEVGITLTSRQIVFTPTADGSYRFCYKFN